MCVSREILVQTSTEGVASSCRQAHVVGDVTPSQPAVLLVRVTVVARGTPLDSSTRTWKTPTPDQAFLGDLHLGSASRNDSSNGQNGTIKNGMQ